MYAVGDEVGISVGFDDGDTLSFHFLLFIFTEVNVESELEMITTNMSSSCVQSSNQVAEICRPPH